MSLVLFFTYNTSLRTWARTGILSREVQLYKRLLPHLGEISFVTYGDSSELTYAKHLEGIRVLYNRWRLPPQVYAQLAPILHMPVLLSARLLKTNQTSGARAALPVRRWFRKKLIARCGFMWSLNIAREYGEHTEIARRVFREEGEAFHKATRVVVTTPSMKSYVEKGHGIDPKKVSVIPNYVDVELLSPSPDNANDGRTICFVGRLTKEKNVGALIEAISGTNLRLLIIGDGPLRQELETKATRQSSDVQFVGPVTYTEVPDYLRQSTLFVLPSLWEGHPKALIEAMACGVPVIGANSPGIRELVAHKDTGYLCDTSPQGIRDAITSVLGDQAIRNRLASNGREFAVESFSLDRVVDMELELYSSLM